jgi:hypothetical protein
MDRRLGGSQSQSGRLEEEKILDPTRTQTPTRHLACSWLLSDAYICLNACQMALQPWVSLNLHYNQSPLICIDVFKAKFLHEKHTDNKTSVTFGSAKWK